MAIGTTFHGAKRRRGAIVAVIVGVVGVFVLYGTASASSGSQTFNYTGAAQTWTVPTGVTSISVDVQGAQGWAGGLGGRVQAKVGVTPGQTLFVFVGGAGTAYAGFNGGGGTPELPGPADLASSEVARYVSGGGGGGASDIRVGATLGDRIIVAGGGGGAGSYGYVPGGAGGGLDAQSGGSGFNGGLSGQGGGGGSQVAGGLGGSPQNPADDALINGDLSDGVVTAAGPGQAGTFGEGGAPGSCNSIDVLSRVIPSFIDGSQTGGGGGGWFGGGGGGCGLGVGSSGGGGGGSSYAAPDLAASVLHAQGYRPGNGVVTISWDTASQTPLPTIPPVPAISPIPTVPPTPSISPAPASYPSDNCDAAGSNVVTGFVDSTYVKSKTATGGPTTTWMCVAGEAGGAHAGGKLTLNASAPGLSVASIDLDNASVSACSANANNVHVNGGQIAGQPWFVDVTPSPAGSTDSAWACVRMTNSVGFRLRFAPGVSVGLPTFDADSTSPHVPAYVEDPWPAAAQPSATCQLANGSRIVNVTVGTTPIALYTWQESLSKAHLCVRGGSTGGKGAELNVDAGGVDTGITTTPSTSPCPFALFTLDNPSLGAYISSPSTSLPASACVAVGSTQRGVTANAPTTGPVVTVQQDSA